MSQSVRSLQFNFIRPITQPGIQRAAVYISCMIICALALFVKYGGRLPSPGEALWAEDGLVFLNDANRYGLSSLFNPYAGYLHFYPRLTSFIATFFDFVTQPTILFCGWILSSIILIFSLSRLFKDTNSWAFNTVCATFLIMFQPTNGEIFLNITNSQWILGASLFLISLSTSKDDSATRWMAAGIAAPLSITGPFSVILLPVIFLKLFLVRDWRKNKYIYISIFLGALIQIYFLNTDNRETRGDIDTDFIIWFESAFKVLLLGAKEPIQYALVAVLWISTIYQIVFKFSRPDIKVATFLLIAALLMIAAGLMSHSHNPAAILAHGSGNRYTWVPYTLIIAALFLIAESEFKKVLFYATCLLMIFIMSFSLINIKSTFFYSYAAFREIKSIVTPINPGVESFPGWHIPEDVTGIYSQDESNYIDYPVEEFDKINLVNPNISKIHYFDSLTNDPMLITREPFVCETSEHFGLTITMERPVQGWTQVFFSSEPYFTELQSFRRWYPEGKVVANFAFPYLEGGVFIRIDPIETPAPIYVQSVNFYCLR